MGQHLVEVLLSKGHSVRGLGRSPSKLAPQTLSTLESFVQSTGYSDIDALDRACSGVDGVICAYGARPELQLEGQLLLLRAAERAQITKFISASWNYDWSNMQLGMQESYDPLISFRSQVGLTSTIRPIYIFCGALAETLFSVPGHGDFSPRNHGVWDPVQKSLDFWGTGHEVWHWTTERDAARFAVAILEREDVAQGGLWTVYSGANSLTEIAAAFESVTGTKVGMKSEGTVSELRKVALEARKNGSRMMFWEYIGYFYQLYTLDGTWTLKENQNAELGIEPTSLEEFIKTSLIGANAA